MSFYQIRRTQYINLSKDEVWDFIVDPHNLTKITPPHMEFEIITPEIPKKIYEGMIICYNVKPLMSFKTKWVTEITHINEGEYFVDEQRVGPYKMWHHEHILKTQGGGTEMVDIISYKMPLGSVGSIVNRLIVTKKLKEIFDYREYELSRYLRS